MTDFRHGANGEAQRAFRRMLDYHFRTGEWNQYLIDEWHAAEDAFDAMPEWLLDAQHEAAMAEMDELRDQELAHLLTDAPLASIPFEWTSIEDWAGGAA